MKNDDNWVIWRDVPIVIQEKGPYFDMKKNRSRFGFYKTLGDIPIAIYNPETKKFESVDNQRGYAYALRRAKRYRKKKD